MVTKKDISIGFGLCVLFSTIITMIPTIVCIAKPCLGVTSSFMVNIVIWCGILYLVKLVYDRSKEVEGTQISDIISLGYIFVSSVFSVVIAAYLMSLTVNEFNIYVNILIFGASLLIFCLLGCCMLILVIIGSVVSGLPPLHIFIVIEDRIN